ncbi:helix-turn-helix domain-containing protein [Clostridium diolis]|uniref:Transcriptional regulator n=1 Tax=Clostridium diolis TaxID=223919 RepID=A0AAV3VZB1_9CLOT|nr:XRE family transcriptional regulator [Clostridium diolis]QES74265.1 helix-turn-helix domain-containing protein [Clostridium diolis]GEA30833.1 transcriptional regulator [Clostridium diolis]
MDINTTVSQNIKHIREQKKLTLDAAAKTTGVSRSMLAQIEKGDVNPTLSVLWKIANGYKVSFTSLIEESEKQATILPFKDITPIVEDSGKYINYPLFTFDEQRLFETYRIVIAPDGGLQAEAHLAGTEEYITVFSGNIEVTVGDTVYSLNEGDSIRFKADITHSYRNIGSEEVILSMLIYYSKRA